MTRLQPERAPSGCARCSTASATSTRATLSRHGIPPPADGRRSAVLILFGHDPEHGPDVLLTERASTLRSHAGQVSFPGGRTDPDDRDAVATALREAEEETGLEPAGVVPWPAARPVHPADRLRRRAGHRALGGPDGRARGRSERDGHRRPGSDDGPGRPARPVPGAPSVRLRRAGVLRGRAGRLGFHGGACCRRCCTWEDGNDPGTQRGCGIWTRHGPRCEPRVGRSQES